jgi:hypothetical protein
MLSTIDRTVVYPVSADITEHDLNIVSDLWTMGGRQVFRGARDPTYSHANVYWLYDEELDRVGVSEHKLENPGDVSLLWYKETPFGTLLQEDGWIESDSIWSRLPEHSYEQFLAEGWTTPMQFLERCLRGSIRIVTPEMIVKQPSVHACEKCNYVSLTSSTCSSERALTFPEKEKVWFIDDRMIVYLPPSRSSVWPLLGFTQPQLPDEPSSEQPEPQVQVQPEESQPEPSPQPQPQPQDPPQSSQ